MEPTAAEADQTAEIMRLQASKPRRAIMLAMIALLGAFIVGLGFRMSTDQFALKALFVVMGIAIFATLPSLSRASARSLVVTQDGLLDDKGQMLAAATNISGVERGAFAFKPSNGFLLRLSAAQPFVWAPGLWWRIGRRVGVGGVISAAEAKLVAETISAGIEPGR